MDGAIIPRIVPQLLLPQEIIQRVALRLVEIVDNISIVHLNGDQSHDDLSYYCWDFSTNDCCEFSQLVDDDVEVVLDGLAAVGIFSDCVLGVERPDDLGCDCDHLTGLGHDPIRLFLVLSVHPFVQPHADNAPY